MYELGGYETIPWTNVQIYNGIIDCDIFILKLNHEQREAGVVYWATFILDDDEKNREYVKKFKQAIVNNSHLRTKARQERFLVDTLDRDNIEYSVKRSTN